MADFLLLIATRLKAAIQLQTKHVVIHSEASRTKGRKMSSNFFNTLELMERVLERGIS